MIEQWFKLYKTLVNTLTVAQLLARRSKYRSLPLTFRKKSFVFL